MQIKKSTPAFLLHKYILTLFVSLFSLGSLFAQVSVTCPPNILQANDLLQCGAIVNYTEPAGTGSGTNITTTLIQGLPSGSYFEVGTTEIIYKVSNDEGDTDQCSFYITVEDNEAPVFTCPADFSAEADPLTCKAIVNFDIPMATDNCGIFSIFQFGGPVSGSSFAVGNHFLDFTAYDLEGNQAFCRVILSVLDTNDPTISCPGDITVSAPASSCSAVVNYTAPTGTDGCSAANTVLTSGIGSGGTFPIGTTVETYTVTDAGGNTATCSFNVNVVDVTPPTISCPVSQTINIGATGCSAGATYDMPTAADNCGGVTITQTQGLASGSTFPAGYNVQKFTATDDAGNTATCQFTIFVQETVAPVITCPSDIVVSNDPGICGAIVNYPAVVSSDNCVDANTDLIAGIASGGIFPLGVTLNTYEVRDNSGNVATCSFSVTVLDTEGPVMDCEDIIVPAAAGLCEAVVNFSAPSATDNCLLKNIVQTGGPVSGSTFNLGNTEIEYTATDDAGNISICTFNVIVTDDQDPVITCPADISFTIPDDQCTTLLTYDDPIVSDNCSGESFVRISGPASGEVVSAGDYTVEFEATDGSGNTASCSFDISIAETEKPVFVDCPGDIVFETEPGSICEGIAVFDTPSATDCSAVTVVQTGGLPSGDVFPAGINPVEFTATDVFGNTASCTFNVILQPADPIAITCTEDIIIVADPGSCEAIVNYDLPVTNDSCNIATVTLTNGLVSGSAFAEGETTVTYEVSDLAGNTATCSFTVTVIDDENPDIVCPGDIVVNIPDGDCDAIVTYAQPVATDNCALSDLSLTSGIQSGESFPVGINTVTYTATDAAGNSTSCSFTVSIFEAVPPSITCPADIEADNDPGICGAIINYTAPEGDDNCGGALTELTAGLAPGSEFPVGTTMVTYTVTDISGNQNSCSFNVTVNDTESPLFACPENITINSAPDICGAVYNFTPPEATDNCTSLLIVSQTSGLITGSTLALGETEFEFATQDEYGNQATCSYTVTVTDITPPVFTNCPSSDTLYLAEGSCTAIANYGSPLASDNCNVTISQTAGPSNGASLSPGSYDYEITATDNAGNSTLCTFTFTVLDTISPVIACIPDFETCDSIPQFDLPTATDNCEIAEIVQISGPTAGSVFPEGENTITFVASDLSGNSDTCSFVITILRNAPTPFAGTDITLCDETSATLSGNDPEGAAVEWILVEGSGIIDSPNTMQTGVSGLGEGANKFVYALDPETGCALKTDTVIIFVEIGVTVTASPDKLIMFGNSTILSAASSPEGGTYSWSAPAGLSCTECDSPEASPGETTQYYVTYTSIMGCTAIDSVLIRVFKELPNTITPDGDGVNDIWNIPEIEKYPNAQVVIYNRWGNSVYESTGYRDPWDGTYNGKDLPTGSYYYILDFKTPGMDNLNGTVNIIR